VGSVKRRGKSNAALNAGCFSCDMTGVLRYAGSEDKQWLKRGPQFKAIRSFSTSAEYIAFLIQSCVAFRRRNATIQARWDGWSAATWTRRPCCVSLGVGEAGPPPSGAGPNTSSEWRFRTFSSYSLGWLRQEENPIPRLTRGGRPNAIERPEKNGGLSNLRSTARIRRDERRSARLIRISVAIIRIARRTINRFQRARRECGGLPRSSQASLESSDPSAQSARIRRRRYARSCTRRPRHCRPRPARFLSPE